MKTYSQALADTTVEFESDTVKGGCYSTINLSRGFWGGLNAESVDLRT